jgi:hypothetical protein
MLCIDDLIGHGLPSFGSTRKTFPLRTVIDRHFTPLGTIGKAEPTRKRALNLNFQFRLIESYPVQFGLAAMGAIPNEPSESNRTGCARTLPAVPVHHRKPFAEDMDACQSAILKNGTAPLGF